MPPFTPWAPVIDVKITTGHDAGVRCKHLLNDGLFKGQYDCPERTVLIMALLNVKTGLSAVAAVGLTFSSSNPLSQLLVVKSRATSGIYKSIFFMIEVFAVLYSFSVYGWLADDCLRSQPCMESRDTLN